MAGIYGKMPSKGDFINRGLAKEFVAVIDPWLQAGMNESRAALGDDWLNYYQIAPIWHYCLSPGVIDQQTWCGVWIPSEDRVNRSFPLTVVAPVKEPIYCIRDLKVHKDWFRICEDFLLSALSHELDFDDFCEQVINRQPQVVKSSDDTPEKTAVDGGSISISNQVDIDPSVQEWVRQSYHQLQKRVASLESMVDQLTQKIDQLTSNGKSQQDSQFDEDLIRVDQSDVQSNKLVLLKNMSHSQEIILDTPLTDVHSQACVWLSSGSEEINHQIVITSGLPDSKQFVKLLTGF